MTTSTLDWQRTSEVLRGLGHDQGDEVSFGEIFHALGERAFALMIFFCALPNCIPMLPGVSTVTGFAILILALQMVAGREEPWLPERIRATRVKRTDVAKLLDRALPWIEKVERLSKPRLHFLTGDVGRRVTGLVIAILAFVLILPIAVVGNIPPALATAIICLGLVERDGIVVAAGYVAGTAATLFVGAVVYGLYLGVTAVI